MSGIICFTFDDCDVAGWTAAIPLFAEYKAHALFSFSGVLARPQLECMVKLHEAGHSLGLHTVHHADAPEYIEKNGAAAYFFNEVAPQLQSCRDYNLRPKNFAFPNNKYNDEAIKLLSPYFRHFRAGGVQKDIDGAFVKRAELTPELKIMRGLCVGEYYHTQAEDVMAAIDRAADRDECLTFTSHGISPAAKGVNMPLELLVKLLEHAAKRGCQMLGLDEI